MACLIKAPSEGSKGVVVFTTQERDRVISPNKQFTAQVEALKDRWLIGLHHNWHDYAFTYNPLYDFSMAGEDDLREVNDQEFPLIPLDACNFVPPCFSPSRDEPFWDILYIARAVEFKRLPEFLQCIRTLYDREQRYRVLLISPMPPYKRSERATTFYELRATYESMFSPEEQLRFTLLDPSFAYPFPFDLETIAHFYRSSRLFVHFADDERRCRVAAYAWAAGVPVVGLDVIGSLLPPPLRKPPEFFSVSEFAEFPDRITEALETSTPGAALAARDVVSVQATVPVLVAKLEELLEAPVGQDPLAVEGLDIRLGRHHGFGFGRNTVPLDLKSFVALLSTEPDRVAAAIRSASDPELELAG
jgi:glycosyltransferase involved in cell wall biosynthesis